MMLQLTNLKPNDVRVDREKLAIIKGGNIGDEAGFSWKDFTIGALGGGVLYDVVKGATIGTTEFVGNNVYEGWSPTDGGFLF